MFPIDRSLLPSLATRRALIVVDPQNDFLAEDGALPVKMPPDLPDRIASLATALRQGGDDIIWVCSHFEKSRPVLDEQVLISDRLGHPRSPDLSRGRRRPTPPQTNQQCQSPEAFLTQESPDMPKCVRPGSFGVEMHPAVKGAVGPKDFSVVKTYYSAFRSEQLLRLLRMRLVTELFICGPMTNVSVMATAVDAASHGYTITLVDDCCGYNSVMQHRNTIKQISNTTGCDALFLADIVASLKHKPKSSKRPSGRPTIPPAGRCSNVRRDGEEDDSAASSTSETLPSFKNLSLSIQRAADTPAIEPSTEDSTPSIQPLVKPTATESGRQSRADYSAPGSDEVDSIQQHQQPLADDSQSSHNAKTNNDDGVPLRGKEVRSLARDNSVISEPTREKVSLNKEEKASVSDPKVLKSTEAQPSTEANDHRPLSGHSLEDTAQSAKITGETPNRRHPERAGTPSEVSEATIDENTTMAPEEQRVPRESEPLCEGDTKVIYDILPEPLSENIFEKVRDEVQWQRMSHQGGEVPRLVAVQGQVDEDGSMPIYRHPADESPPLLPFSSTVMEIKKVVEDRLGHPLNHVLIQFYRDGNDYISEHSDKTLDIVKGSFIANVSLGAERTMTLRTKRQPRNRAPSDVEPPATELKRQVQRARLPHNSLFQMGLKTNMRWLHGIRQDKRMEREKAEEELAYDGGRISLTFRQIGTFLDRENRLIWGQGATAKTREAANNVINGQTPEAVKMLRSFGRENQSTEFDWDEHYGSGFDVLHINTAPRLFLSLDAIVNMRIQLMLAEYGIGYARGSMSPLFNWKDGKSAKDPEAIPKDLPVKFVDNNSVKSVVQGEVAIMRYLDRVYGQKLEGDASHRDPTKEVARFEQGIALLAKYRESLDDLGKFKAELSIWEGYAAEGNDFIAGPTMTLADFAFWPILNDITRIPGQCKFWEITAGLENLKAYYERIRSRESGRAVLTAHMNSIREKPSETTPTSAPTPAE